MADLSKLLACVVEHGASDLFLSVGAAPTIKVEGVSTPLTHDKLAEDQVRDMAYSILNKDQIETFENTFEMNLAHDEAGVGRFRINIYKQRGFVALVARHVKDEIKSIQELGLPKVLEKLIMGTSGLVLVVGSTGSGKSTTLASMLNYRNQNQTGHILTIEDPIEYLHHHQQSIVDQREVGFDTLSYGNALKNAMREAPDVIMIGELRDTDTTKQAIAYAETGHLCLSTLHSNTTYQSIERIINFFPETAHKQLLQDLSQHLRAIISQRLVIGLDGKRVPAIEIMLNSPFVAELIMQGRIDEIHEALERNEKAGYTFDQSLFDLVAKRKISIEEAMKNASSKANLALKIRLELDKQAGGGETLSIEEEEE